MKYKVIKSDLLLNGKIIPENSEADLSESETKGIEEYLLPCHPEPASPALAVVEGSNDTKETKTKRGNK